MKVKILKEADQKAPAKKIVHGFYISLDKEEDVLSLCGQPGDKYSWNNNVHLKKITCPKCLVMADQLLESGKIILVQDDVMRESPAATLKIVYSQEIVTDYASEEAYGEWQKEMNSKFEGVCLKTSSPYHLEYSTRENIRPGDKVYVAWCTYGTGDTFGHSSGEFDIIKVSKEPLDMEEMRSIASSRHNDYFGGLEEVFIETSQIQETI